MKLRSDVSLETFNQYESREQQFENLMIKGNELLFSSQSELCFEIFHQAYELAVDLDLKLDTGTKQFLQAIQFRHQVAKTYLDSKEDYPPILVFLTKLVRAKSNGSQPAKRVIFQILAEQNCDKLKLNKIFKNNLLQRAKKAGSLHERMRVLKHYDKRIQSSLDWFSKREILAGLLHLVEKSCAKEIEDMLALLFKMRKFFQLDSQFVTDIDQVIGILKLKVPNESVDLSYESKQFMELKAKQKFFQSYEAIRAECKEKVSLMQESIRENSLQACVDLLDFYRKNKPNEFQASLYLSARILDQTNNIEEAVNYFNLSVTQINQIREVAYEILQMGMSSTSKDFKELAEWYLQVVSSGCHIQKADQFFLQKLVEHPVSPQVDKNVKLGMQMTLGLSKAAWVEYVEKNGGKMIYPAVYSIAKTKAAVHEMIGESAGPGLPNAFELASFSIFEDKKANLALDHTENVSPTNRGFP